MQAAARIRLNVTTASAPACASDAEHKLPGGCILLCCCSIQRSIFYLALSKKEIIMIKDSFKKITILCLVLAMLLAVSSCDSDPASDGSDIQTMNVTLTILYPQKAAADSSKNQSGQTAESREQEQTQESSQSLEDSQTQGDNASPENLENYVLQVEEKATVIQILEAYSNQEGVRIQVSSTDPHRITAINGIAETNSLGWSYEINGKAGDPEDVATDELKDGDQVTWVYGKTK